MKWQHCEWGAFLFADERFGTVSTLQEYMVCRNEEGKVIYLFRKKDVDRAFVQGPYPAIGSQ